MVRPSAAREKPVVPGLRLLERIGRGGTSEVWLAEEEGSGRRVALKLLDDAAPEGARDRIRQATDALRALRHPSLIGVLDTGEVDGRPYLLLEHVDGDSLHERVRRDGPLSEAEARELAIQAGEGLREAAGAGLVHGDVEPGNLLLDGDGRLRVCDLERRPEAGDDLFGTPAFLAPERLRGLGIDARADIYSLGLTLYFAVTGELPYAAADVVAVLRQQAEAPLPDPRAKRPGLSDGFVRLLARMTAKDPGERPASWTAVLRELRSGDGAMSEVRRAFLGTLRGPTRLALVGLLIVAAALVGVKLALGPGDPVPRLDAEAEAEARGALAELERSIAEQPDELEPARDALLEMADRYAGTAASARARERAIELGDRIEHRRREAFLAAAARAQALADANSFDRALEALAAVEPLIAGSRQEPAYRAERERIDGLARTLLRGLEKRVAPLVEKGDLDGAEKLLDEAPADRAGGLREWIKERRAFLQLQREARDK